jgi:membrane protease YdiL (CAAX protease family)
MSKSKSPRPRRRNTADRFAYLDTSRRPLQILAFLLPLVLLYEASLVLLLRSDQGTITNKSHETLLAFFAAFGIPVHGFFIGALVVIVVLLLWHMLNRDPWQVDIAVVGYMALESLALAFPLLVAGQVIQQLFHSGHPTSAALELAQAMPAPLAGLNLFAKWALSIGAGLYEELMFRMLLIAVIHTLLVDVGKASHNLGATIAVVVSAAAFTWYHHPVQGADIVFYFLAGLYFGAVYVIRGFGIVVGVHALYDVITFTLLAPQPPG